MDVIESYRHLSPTSMIEGEVAGLALPFNVSDDREGLWLSDEGALTFFAYSVYDRHSLDAQLALADLGGRVRFMWAHGLHGGMTTIPIGNVLSLTATPEALMFRARLNDTDVADEIRKALATMSIKEVSVQIKTLDHRFETDNDAKTFRRVTRAQIFDVSLLAHGQFPQARLLEVLCEGCGWVTPAQDEHKPPADSNHRPLFTPEQVGALYARINDLQAELRLQKAKEVQQC